MHLLTLIFGTVLLSEAYSLICHKCLPGSTATCELKTCPSVGYQCSVLRITSYAGGSKLSDIQMKTCVLNEDCAEGSVNFGLTRNVITSKCCNPISATPKLLLRFFCDSSRCIKTLSSHTNIIFVLSVNVGGETIITKGCASKQICSNTKNAQFKGVIGGDISCCEGDYCNSASSTSAGLLLLVTPLISLVMFS
uniref:UPAR/Ly6 domain-containing protein n=1 Tax=Dicentrarchus labrax TaxID=13489 RepID=A0A8C4EXV3_DICLA